MAAPSVTGLLLGLRFAGLLQPLELAVFDQFFQLRPSESIDTRIVIVAIGEADIRESQKWPMPDATLAKLLEAIRKQQPRAIGLDLYRDLPHEPGHQALVKVFESTPNLFGIQKVVGNLSGFVVNPPPALSKLGQVSANDLVVDSDGKVRRNVLLLSDPRGELIFTLGTDLALTYLAQEGIELETLDEKAGIYQLGKATISSLQASDGGYMRIDIGGYQTLSNFRNLRQGFETIPLQQVLRGQVPTDIFRDRIVLIGITAESAGDVFRTPYSSDLNSKTANWFSGVSIHADIASQLISAALEGRPLFRTWSEPLECLWILAWALLGATLSWMQRYHRLETSSTKSHLPQLPITPIGVLVASGGLVGVSYIMFLHAWWIPVVPPLIGLVGTASVITTYIAHTAAEMRQTFGRYLTDEVVANLLETPGGLKLGGERRKVTILISDLRGFSAISERVSPEEAVTIINLYLEQMTNILNHYQGTINDFLGDGIFVMFGTPVHREDDAQRAVACAIAMQLEMDSINAKLTEMNLPTLAMGIGIHTGEVLAGNIGSQRRAKYTIMGKHVNLASRIESYTVGGQILISDDTLQEAGSSVQFESVMQVRLKGIQNPVSVYDVSGIGDRFNLCLPKTTEVFVNLPSEIPLQYRVLEGKHLITEVFHGNLLKLSPNQAEIYTDYPLELFSNLQINLLIESEVYLQGIEPTARDIYAKVVAQKSQPSHHFVVQFTAIPTELVTVLQKLRVPTAT